MERVGAWMRLLSFNIMRHWPRFVPSMSLGNPMEPSVGATRKWYETAVNMWRDTISIRRRAFDWCCQAVGSPSEPFISLQSDNSTVHLISWSSSTNAACSLFNKEESIQAVHIIAICHLDRPSDFVIAVPFYGRGGLKSKLDAFGRFTTDKTKN